MQTNRRPNGAPVGGRAISSLKIKGYPLLYLSGYLWNVTRWMGIFIGSFLVNEATGSPLAVQLVGTSFFLPMFVGGIAAGAVSDRFDRRRTLLRNLAFLTPLSAIMAVLVATDTWEVWMIYLFVFAVGIGGVLDMTNRRALVYDLVGPEHVTNAVALEMVSLSIGNTLGFLAGGTVLDFLGSAWAFGLVAACYLGSLLTLLAVQPVPRLGEAAAPSSLSASLTAGARLVRSSTNLRSILGVTVLVNLFMFSFVPMIPVFAENLELSPFSTGLLGSAIGTGMTIGSLGVAAFVTNHRGLVYVIGSVVAIGCLIGLALAPGFLVAYPSVLVAGIGAGMFGATQSALVMSVADDDTRGRAMGTLAMAIGALPFGILVLGVSAELLGPSTALLTGLITGLALMAVWLFVQPAVRRID